MFEFLFATENISYALDLNSLGLLLFSLRIENTGMSSVPALPLNVDKDCSKNHLKIV